MTKNASEFNITYFKMELKDDSEDVRIPKFSKNQSSEKVSERAKSFKPYTLIAVKLQDPSKKSR